tara:strand:- start:66 stop:614 length:549 start_codon:yes stop_codon:yes gene_type:complete
MFVEDGIEWWVAQQILETIGKRKTTKFYLNENGQNECDPNMGIVAIDHFHREGGCPNLWGNLAITMPKSHFEDNCWSLPDDPFAYESEDESEDEVQQRFKKCNTCEKYYKVEHGRGEGEECVQCFPCWEKEQEAEAQAQAQARARSTTTEFVKMLQARGMLPGQVRLRDAGGYAEMLTNHPL